MNTNGGCAIAERKRCGGGRTPADDQRATKKSSALRACEDNNSGIFLRRLKLCGEAGKLLTIKS